jgi:hypothetical protein
VGRCLLFLPRYSLSGGLGDFVGFGGLMLEETEGSVALAEDASLQEASEALGKFV